MSSLTNGLQSFSLFAIFLPGFNEALFKYRCPAATARADDDVIEQWDAEHFAGVGHHPCHGYIFATWLRVTAGVVVHQDQAAGTGTNQGTKDISCGQCSTVRASHG